jgi:adenylate cyclase
MWPRRSAFADCFLNGFRDQSHGEKVNFWECFREGRVPKGYTCVSVRTFLRLLACLAGATVDADFHVGEWLIEPNLSAISRNRATVHLQPKVMGVLVCLAQHAGEPVSKERLLEAVWPDAFVTDDVLKHCIAELRRVFGDDAQDPAIIQTIPKRGYRLVAQVSACEASKALAAIPKHDSIAVLPFLNLSADPDNEYFADGVTEEIINALAQIEQLSVVARSSAFSFKGKHLDPRSVGQQLNVRRILEGSVRRAEHRLRITAQLIDVENGYHLWSQRYDRELKDVFEIQDEIARSIADRLKITFSGIGQGSLVKPGTKNVEAYQLYAKGRALLYRRGGAIPSAVQCFEQAVAIDSDYALAWAGLADSYTTLGYYGLAHPNDSMPKGMEAAQRAVALDGSLAEAHNALAMASLMGVWDKAQAEREFLLATRLNPTYVQARDWYALFFLQFAEGRLNEGADQAKLALVSDPLSPYAHAIYGITCAIAGREAEGIQMSRRAIELDPDSYLARYILHFVLHASGKFEESVAVGESALAMSGRHSWSMATLAVCLADLGKPEDADAVYQEMLARGRRQYVPPALLALAGSAASREDEAMSHAREAYRIRDPHCEVFLSRHINLPHRLYADARFREIVDHVSPR